MTSPLVSVAIPLYQSKRFLDIIIQNVEGQDYPNLEFIISDRHCLDNTVALLRERWAAKTNVRFIQKNDAVNWVQHYNDLLKEAHGAYFIWMPHDDDFSPNYVSALVQILESKPDVILAYGEIQSLSLDGRKGWYEYLPIPLRSSYGSQARYALGLLLQWGQLGDPFRGVFRLKIVKTHQLWMPNSYQTIGADVYWVFAMAFLGNIERTTICYTRKRFYHGSTSANWKRTMSYWENIKDRWQGLRLFVHFMHRFTPQTSDRWLGYGLLGLDFLLKIVYDLVRDFVSPTLKKRVRMFFYQFGTYAKTKG